MEKTEDVVISTQQANTFLSSIASPSSSSSSSANGGDINYGSLINSNIPNLNSLTNNSSNSSASNSNTNSSNTNNCINEQKPSNAYNMPGILHFLQHEWNRFEYERQQWDIDRAELMTKISFLQGERRGQENLKNSLIRRIKMLELALKQERIKYHKQKYGAEPSELAKSQATASTNAKEYQEANEIETNNTFSIDKHPILNKENSSTSAIKQGRHLLKQYLQEIGCTDTVIDIRSSRLRSLLGLGCTNNLSSQQTKNETSSDLLPPPPPFSSNNNINNNNTTNSYNQQSSGSIAPLLNGVGTGNANSNKLLQLNTNRKFLNGTAETTILNSNLSQGGRFLKLNSDAEAQNDDDEEEMMDEEDLSHKKKDFQIDADTEDALNEFDFLSNEKSSNNEQHSSSSSSDWGHSDENESSEQLAEQYKKENRTKASNKSQQITIDQSSGKVNRTNRSALQAMIANLAENSSSDSSSSLSSSDHSDNDLNESTNQVTHKLNPKMFLEDESFGISSSNLGELSHISVNNSTINISGINDETIEVQKKVMTTKFSLRGHFDSVRCLAFHPTESALLTGSEDQTIKLWNLDKSSLNSKKNSNSDIEPVYTFRKHLGPVLSLVVSQNGDYCISSSLDSKIFVWNMPNFETSDQYDQYNPNVFMKYLNGHTDAVWSMALVDNTLVTVSADSTLRVWNPFSIDDLDETAATSLSCLNEDKSQGIPTSVDFINNESSRIVASFGSTHHSLYDIETAKLIHKFDYHDLRTNTHCYKVISHPATGSSSSSLVISAHEDKKIRFFDINSGKLVYQMVAHQDACTDIAIDPTCFYLLSASHDCSIRLWNLDNKNCIQELTSHRKKFDESINCVAFHPTKPFIASGGADAIVKIYV